MDSLKTKSVSHEEFRRLRSLDLPELLAAMHRLDAEIVLSEDDETLRIMV